MSKFLVLGVYNLLLPIFFIVAFPAWLMKMVERGGLGSGLLERFGFFKEAADFEKQGATYIHAVSVGEVLIAVKLIKEWQGQYPEERFLLVPTTATGHAVALEHAPDNVTVIYSPLDFGFILHKVFKRFAPKQIVLMESEIWPNMLNVAQKMGIPVSIANARLSDRSEDRYMKLGFILRPLLEMISKLCAQDDEDKKRWVNVGVAADKVVVTGSVKFDQDGASVIVPQKREEFSNMLHGLQHEHDEPVVMAISTHAGEEVWIEEALNELQTKILLVLVPRHAERRAEVKKELEDLGNAVVLRSDYKDLRGATFVVDSTGELRDWTAHADIVIVGKSILGKGGQNPTEAMAVRVPVITGPNMQNFQPLVADIKGKGGLTEISSKKELSDAVQRLLSDKEMASGQCDAALEVLEFHQGATSRTVTELG